MKPVIWVLEASYSDFESYNKVLGFRALLESFLSRETLVDELSTRTKKPDLIIADLKMSGIYLPADSHENQLQGVPFIVTSACDDVDIIRLCFRLGAYDFIRKPLVASELLARIDRFLSRLTLKSEQADEQQPQQIDCPTCARTQLRHEKCTTELPFHLDNTTLTLSRGPNSAVTLTAKEFRIVSLLSKSRQQKLTKREITKSIWGDVRVVSKTLDVHLANLRKKTSPIGIDICSTSQGECAMILREIA